MENKQKLEYVENEVKKNITNIKRKADNSKNRTYAISISSTVLGALVTVALGLQTDSFAIELKSLALICGALITVVNAVESVFAYRSLWIKQKGTLLDLYELRNEIEFYKAGLEERDPIDGQQVTQFFEKYQEIWKTSSSEWLRLRKEQEQEAKNKGS